MRAAALTLCLLLAGCGAGGSGPALFVLGRPPAPSNSATRQSGLPILEVKPVQLPGYLDTTDLLVRGPGGQVIPSQT
ncbi:MAG TPA: ABC-type transport auxiliary lipoprotein family protein, partial [Solirubrobacteraceae bacterium]